MPVACVDTGVTVVAVPSGPVTLTVMEAKAFVNDCGDAVKLMTLTVPSAVDVSVRFTDVSVPKVESNSGAVRVTGNAGAPTFRGAELDPKSSS